jgi:rubrerythrin
MLPVDIQSPGQLLGIAVALAQEAVRHYGDLAARMRHYGNTESVALFERLESESREREAKLIELAQLEDIELVEMNEAVTWEDPLMSTTYDAQARDPYRSTPYKALAYAAHNTDRAFHLYTHISATTTDAQTEHYAKILAGDALNRSRLLQSRRRRAYHSEQRGPWQKQLDAALSLKTATELYAVSAGIEQRLADLLTTMAKHYEDLLPIAKNSHATVEQCQQHLADGIPPTIPPPPPYNMDHIGQDLHQDILLIFTESERAFSFYDAVMAHAFEEDIMLISQELSESALLRLEAIRTVQEKYGIPPAAQ